MLVACCYLYATCMPAIHPPIFIEVTPIVTYLPTYLPTATSTYRLRLATLVLTCTAFSIFDTTRSSSSVTAILNFCSRFSILRWMLFHLHSTVSQRVAFVLLLRVVSLVKTGCISNPHQYNPWLHSYLILRQNLRGV